MNKLKAKIIDRGLSVAEFLRQTGISRDLWYRRCRKGPQAFRVEEVLTIAKALDLSDAEVREIFLL